MAVKTSGPLSLGGANTAGVDISEEFGGNTPHSLSEYYEGQGLVPPGTGIPTIGNTISFNQFYGTQATVYFSITGGNAGTSNSDSGGFRTTQFTSSGNFTFNAGTDAVEFIAIGGGGSGSGGTAGTGGTFVNGNTVASTGTGVIVIGGFATTSTLNSNSGGFSVTGTAGSTGAGAGVSGRGTGGTGQPAQGSVPGSFPGISVGNGGNGGPEGNRSPGQRCANGVGPGSPGNAYGGGGGGGGRANCGSSPRGVGDGPGSDGAGAVGTVAIRYKLP